VPHCDGVRFNDFVKHGFAQRRKLLRKNLALWSNARGTEPLDWPALCAHLGVLETCRAEELSLEQWIALTNWVSAECRVRVPSRENAARGSHSPLATRHFSLSAQDVHGEIFDVVDAEDRVTGQASRHEVHRQKLLHRAVHIFVFNKAGELFLQRRSKWKDMHPLCWDSSAAGHVNAGQTYDETAPREIEEELGVSASVEPLAAIPPSAATGWEHVRLYRAAHDGPFLLHPAELDGGGFFTLEQIDRWTAARPVDFATGFIECWRVFRAAG
jgi:16S rRNA (adenine1518-N6/adenine1519-N6)-dimethyltransferase